jgi:cytochrome c nitrite reductase small subunit
MLLRNLHAIIVTILKLGFLRPGHRIPAMILLGLFCGLGLLLAHISRATSYLIDSPDTCMNCHVMTDVYVSHAHSSHGRDVTCNDCHLPHTSFLREYAFKASDGLRHAAFFTLRLEPQSMKLSAGAVPVVQENCMRCHEERVSEVSAGSYQKGDQRCWDCHRDIVHGRVHSLSASPSVSRPALPCVTAFPPIPSLPTLFDKENKTEEDAEWDARD